jgi:hypothetical protein
LPRLAIQGWIHGLVGRLHDVQIRDGEIRGTRPDPSDLESHWDPLGEYFSDEKPPYMKFVALKTNEASIIQFVERYGIPTYDKYKSSGDTVVWSVGDFDLEHSVFYFILRMYQNFRPTPNEQGIRALWQEWLSTAVTKTKAVSTLDRSMIAWRNTVNQVHTMLSLSVPAEGMSRPHLVQLRGLQEYFSNIDTSSLVNTTSRVVTGFIAQKISKLKPWFVFDVATRSAQLKAYCDGLLEQYYWMLANDLQNRRTPTVCIACRRIFFTEKENARYCPSRPDCKERGRRRVDRERNKDKYNENKRLKRRRLKEA